MKLLPNDILLIIIDKLDLKSLLIFTMINTNISFLLKDYKKIKWLHSIPRICVNDRWTLTHAIKDDKFEYCKWMIENGIEWDIFLSLQAARRNRIHFLNYFHKDLKKPYSKYIKVIGIRDNHKDVIDWCINLGY